MFSRHRWRTRSQATQRWPNAGPMVPRPGLHTALAEPPRFTAVSAVTLSPSTPCCTSPCYQPAQPPNPTAAPCHRGVPPPLKLRAAAPHAPPLLTGFASACERRHRRSPFVCPPSKAAARLKPTISFLLVLPGPGTAWIACLPLHMPAEFNPPALLAQCDQASIRQLLCVATSCA